MAGRKLEMGFTTRRRFVIPHLTKLARPDLDALLFLRWRGWQGSLLLADTIDRIIANELLLRDGFHNNKGLSYSSVAATRIDLRCRAGGCAATHRGVMSISRFYDGFEAVRIESHHWTSSIIHSPIGLRCDRTAKERDKDREFCGYCSTGFRRYSSRSHVISSTFIYHVYHGFTRRCTRYLTSQTRRKVRMRSDSQLFNVQRKRLSKQ